MELSIPRGSAVEIQHAGYQHVAMRLADCLPAQFEAAGLGVDSTPAVTGGLGDGGGVDGAAEQLRAIVAVGRDAVEAEPPDPVPVMLFDDGKPDLPAQAARSTPAFTREQRRSR